MMKGMGCGLWRERERERWVSVWENWYVEFEFKHDKLIYMHGNLAKECGQLYFLVLENKITIN